METQTITNKILRVLKMDLSIFWSWGVEYAKPTQYKQMTGIELKVNGLLHKGIVIVALNEGSDTYEVYKLNNKQEELEGVQNVYVDELVSVCDRLIETENPNSKEYRKQITNQIIRL